MHIIEPPNPKPKQIKHMLIINKLGQNLKVGLYPYKPWLKYI